MRIHSPYRPLSASVIFNLSELQLCLQWSNQQADTRDHESSRKYAS